jgi:putative flippase GtrA
MRFGLAGPVNGCFSYAAFAALMLLGVGPLGALIGATVAGVAFNFQTSRWFVFQEGGHGRGLRFVSLYGVLLVLNWATLRTLRATGLPELAAQALLILPIAALSFLGQKVFVFRTTAAGRE